MGERFRRSAPIVLAAVVAVVLLAWFALGSRREREPADLAAAGASVVRAKEKPAVRPPERPRALPTLRAGETAAKNGPAEGGGGDDAATMEGLVPAPDMDAMAAAWATVDMDEVHKAMSDNLYFELSAPTQDEAVKAKREAGRARWNVEYGKILSGTGTEKEIRDYYDFRARLSTDYVEFTSYLLDRYMEQLPERDIGLLQLARRLHLARLEEIPRKVEEALARKHQQDEARAAWLADEADFRAHAPDADTEE